MSELTDLVIQAVDGDLALAVLLVAGFAVDVAQSRSLSDDLEDVRDRVDNVRKRVQHLEQRQMTDGGRTLESFDDHQERERNE